MLGEWNALKDPLLAFCEIYAGALESACELT